MPVIINLDVIMAKRKISSNELAEKIGITPSTLDKICEVLQCQPGDILEWRNDNDE